MSRWRSFLRRAWEPLPYQQKYEIFHCPKCGGDVRRFSQARSRWYTGYTPRETLARCPVDGWAPWNTPAVRKMEGGLPPD